MGKRGRGGGPCRQASSSAWHYQFGVDDGGGGAMVERERGFCGDMYSGDVLSLRKMMEGRVSGMDCSVPVQ